jgi:hypothetical protein
MKNTSRFRSRSMGIAAALGLAALTVTPSTAQQISGVPGSPNATVTIDGKQLPPPPMKFRGVIKEGAVDSKPYWPPRVAAPKGAPNVLLIMTDDQGYGVSSTFGGVIPTPSLDRISCGITAMQHHGSEKTTTRRKRHMAFRAPSISGHRAWASSISMALWAPSPISTPLGCSAITARSRHGSASPATTSPPIWATRQSVT